MTPPKVAICADQSQVGLRLWLESFAKSDEDRRKAASKPNEDVARERLEGSIELLQAITKASGSQVSSDTDKTNDASSHGAETRSSIVGYQSFRYRAKGTGRWGIAPRGRGDDDSWSKEWCKPSPRMLMRAIADGGTVPARTLVVGQEQRDEEAAKAAGADFAWAATIFGGGLLSSPPAFAGATSGADRISVSAASSAEEKFDTCAGPGATSSTRQSDWILDAHAIPCIELD